MVAKKYEPRAHRMVELWLLKKAWEEYMDSWKTCHGPDDHLDELRQPPPSWS